MQSGGGLTIFHGTKDTLICGCYGQNPWLLSYRVPNAPKVCRRVPKAMNGGHEMDWVRACKESPSSRVMPKSDFSEAGPMNEMVAMGVLPSVCRPEQDTGMGRSQHALHQYRRRRDIAYSHQGRLQDTQRSSELRQDMDRSGKCQGFCRRAHQA